MKPKQEHSGFIIVDKPAGFTSHDIVEEMRRYFKDTKVGHLGTLDPMATGVLPIAVGKATKLTSLLLNADKVYTAEILFGVQTDTLDITGEVIERDADFSGIDPYRLQDVLTRLTGEMEQIPPEYSALRVNGERAYRLVRKGRKPRMKPRKIKIYSMELGRIEGDKAVVKIRCSKGTYVRALARDIARELGTLGTLSALRREQTGPFSLEQAIPLHEAIEALERGDVDAVLHDIIPEKLGLKTLVVGPKMIYRVRHGIPPRLSQTRYLNPPAFGEVVALTSEEGELLAIARFVPSGRGDFEFLRVMG